MKKNFLKEKLACALLLIVVGFLVPLHSADQSKYPLEPVFIEPGFEKLASSPLSMVTSAFPFATNAGLEMLRRGGNAMDATIAATMVTAVVDTGLTTLAGGGQITYYEAKTKRTVTFNFEPHSFKEDVMPYNRERDDLTGRSIRVGGSFTGFYLAIQKYGALPWKEVLEPAIFYAENGFPLHFGSLFPVLIRDLASLFRKEEPLERKQRPDHVFADLLCVPLGCSPDLAVDVETGMAPSENLLDQGEADELFPKQQGEDFMGEELSNKVIMETRDTMEDTLWSCASFSYKDMNVGVEIDAVSESLDNRDDSRHKHKACDDLEVFQESFNRSKREG